MGQQSGQGSPRQKDEAMETEVREWAFHSDSELAEVNLGILKARKAYVLKEFLMSYIASLVCIVVGWGVFVVAFVLAATISFQSQNSTVTLMLIGGFLIGSMGTFWRDWFTTKVNKRFPLVEPPYF